MVESRHPGAVDVADDGIDQDCNGTDTVNLDRDGDGANRPQDCNDADATIHPGAVDVPGDAIDQDCDGVVVEKPPVPAGLSFNFATTGPKTEILVLRLKPLAKGTKVTVTCRGAGCRFKTQNGKASKAGTLDVRKLLRNAPFRAGSKLSIKLTNPG